MNNYLELTKPRITWLILMSTAIGYFFGWDGTWNGWLLLHTILGTGLIASGTAALNQWYEHDADAKMLRTNKRPIPSGRVNANNALWFGVAIAVLGFVELSWGVNLLTGLLGLFTLASYLFIYTPMKQKSWLSTTVGAVPGAMPPMIGFAAAKGALMLKPGFCSLFCSCGSSPISTQSPGCIERIMAVRESACFPLWSPTAIPHRGIWWHFHWH